MVQIYGVLMNGVNHPNLTILWLIEIINIKMAIQKMNNHIHMILIKYQKTIEI